MVATPRRNHHDGRSAASVPTAERAAPALHSGGVDLAAAAAALLISPATALAWLATNRYGLCLCGVREREREYACPECAANFVGVSGFVRHLGGAQFNTTIWCIDLAEISLTVIS
jgi:hypothetical protein